MLMQAEPVYQCYRALEEQIIQKKKKERWSGEKAESDLFVAAGKNI